MNIRNVVIGLIVSALVAGVVVSCGGGGGGGSPAPAAPPVASGTGRGAVVADGTTSITGSFSFMGVSGTPTSAGIYVAPAGQNQLAANALIPLTINRTTAFVPAGTPALTANQLTDLQNGNFYFVLKTSTFPNGEIRGQLSNSANLTAGLASLDGAQAGFPLVTATGAGVFVVDSTTRAIIAGVTTYGGAFTSAVTLAHIHSAAQANAVRVDFTPVTQTFSTPTDPETGISATDLTDFNNSNLYYNVHTVTNGGGEIRGALVPTTTQTVRSASLDTTQVVP